ncbi:MAG: FCD domain-containing protein [Cyanobacteria bacterium P01_A01_bin.15]
MHKGFLLLSSSSSPPLYERVYLTLRASILTGEIRLGERLVESQLAQQLDVSRTPVREAIRRLQQEQLITADSPDGLTIVEISLDSAIQLYDCRIALEQLAVESACHRATPAQIQALKQNLVASGTLTEQPDDSQTLKRLELNYDFHHLVAQSSQNPWLISLLDQLSNQVKLLRLQILQAPMDVDAIQQEHWQIVDAIALGDAETAKQHIRQHLELSQTRIVNVFKRHSYRPQTSQLACPRCGSHRLRKNGRRQHRQNYRCKDCGRQFLTNLQPGS